MSPVPQNLGGVSFTGSVWLLDISAVKTPANFPPMRSLQFCQTYQSQGDADDGALIVYVPSSGQVVRLASPGPLLTRTNPDVSLIDSLSGIIPIVSNPPTQIWFGKEQNASVTAITGVLTATLFDFKIEPYTISGVTNQL